MNAKIKICGIRRMEDCSFLNEAKPDYAGFIFWPKSFRCVGISEAAELREAIDPDIVTVGVFVDESPETIVKIVETKAISIVQLHGHEDNAYITALRRKLPENIGIWKAFKVRSGSDIEAAENSAADKVLLDNGYGTGECFDHSLIGRSFGRPYILAGGLTPENIPEVIRQYGPEMVDISSGVETDKVKDRMKMQKAVSAARGMEQS